MGQSINVNPLVNDIGTINALAVEIDGAGYYDGQQCTVRVANTNNAAVTLSISGRTAKAVKKLHDQAIASGEVEAGSLLHVMYDSTSGVFQVLGGLSVDKDGGATGSTGATGATWATGSTGATGATL